MKTALLIVDMQKDFVEPGGVVFVDGGKAVIPNIMKVLDAFRASRRPIVHVIREHSADGSDVEKFRIGAFKEKPYAVRGSKGAEVVNELKPAKGEIVLPKTRYSGFMHTNLDAILRRLDVDTLVITGIQTPNCVRATAMDALALDYDMILLSDAIAAKTPEIHKNNIEDMAKMAMRVMTTDELIRSLK